MRRKNFLKRGLSTVLPHNFSDRILKQYRQILNGNEDLAKALTAADNATLHSVSGVVISNERDIRTGKLLPFRGTRKEKRKFRKVWRKGFKSFLDVETTTLYFNVIDRLRFSNSKANCVALTKRHKKKCLKRFSRQGHAIWLLSSAKNKGSFTDKLQNYAVVNSKKLASRRGRTMIARLKNAIKMKRFLAKIVALNENQGSAVINMLKSKESWLQSGYRLHKDLKRSDSNRKERSEQFKKILSHKPFMLLAKETKD
jgi:hypothetical protein